jgi:putative ATP-dependent endonuclease of OLD family
MKIQRLTIKNFRSLENVSFELPNVCAIVGANNVGKSNILEAIKRVLGASWLSVSNFSPDDVYMRDAVRSVEIVCHLSPGIPYQRVRGCDPVDVHALRFEYTRYKIGEKKGQPRLEQQCLDDKGDLRIAMVKPPRKGSPPEFAPIVGIPSEIRDQVPLIYIGTNRSLKEHLPGARFSLLRTMFELINRDLQNPKKMVAVGQADGTLKDVQIGTHFNNLMAVAMQLLRTDEFVKVEEAIKKHVLEQLNLDTVADVGKLDLFFTPLSTMDFYKTLDLLIQEDGFSVSAQEMGEGMQNAIVLGILQAFEQTQRQGAIFLIEEPEMFLHPQMQRSLYKTLRRIGETNQVIYTTHSPHFVSVPEYNEVLRVNKNQGRSTVQFSSLPVTAKRREKLIKELDPERGELFFAKRLLVVEGDTEKLAFPEYAKRLGLDLDRLGATIVEVGGKRNLMDIAQIAISFGIPTGIVYDRDSSDFANKRSEEESYNQTLDALAADDRVRVWRLGANYEDELRVVLTEQTYQRLCQKYPDVGKPTRARLIATEQEAPVPPKVIEILQWLGGQKPVAPVPLQEQAVGVADAELPVA